MSKPNKTLKVGGQAHIVIDGEELSITPSGGLISVIVFDTSGLVTLMHHPLSGWYIESDMRHSKPTESEDQP